MLQPGSIVFRIRGLTKRRAAGGTAFEVSIPELEIRAGEKIALVGPSGSGKSTLLDVLALASQPDRCDEFLLGVAEDRFVDIAGLWRAGSGDRLAQLRSRQLGYVLQTGGLLSFLSVAENIAISCRLLGQPPEEPVRRLSQMLGIARHLRKRPTELSVGERQRVAIARALAHGPAIVIADEPTASLDPVTGDRVMGLFAELVALHGITAIVASHDGGRLAKLEMTVLAHRLDAAGDALVHSEFSRDANLIPGPSKDQISASTPPLPL